MTYRQDAAAQYRVAVPRAERRHPWLRHLFDMYALVDASVREALAAAGESGKRSACAKGCTFCCHQPIPVTPLEVAGLQWYAREEMAPDVLAALRARPEQENPAGYAACRFLFGGVCSLYMVRPVACRRFMVFGDACRAGEDVLTTRPHDVLQPSRAALNAACARKG